MSEKNWQKLLETRPLQSKVCAVFKSFLLDRLFLYTSVSVPKTIENMREPDETTVIPSQESNGTVDEEVIWDISNDEFRDYFGQTYEPKVLLTSTDNPHSVIEMPP
jgi:hypothetical protein